MSSRAQNAVWDFSRADATLLNIALKMADWANDDGICHPSFRELARKCRCHRRTVIRGVAQLMAWGEVERRSRRKTKGAGAGRTHFLRGQATNEYRICLVDRLPESTLTDLAAGKKVVTRTSLPTNAGSDLRGSQVVAFDPASDYLSTNVTKSNKSSGAGAPHPVDNEATYKQLEKLVHEALELEGFELISDLTDAVKTRLSRLGFTYQPPILSRAIASVLAVRGLAARVPERQIR